MKCSLGISDFLEEISRLSHSIVFLFFFALIPEEGFLSLLAILWNSAFKWVYLSFIPLLFTSLLFTAICKASSDSHFVFLHFFFLGMVLIPVSCTMSPTMLLKWLAIRLKKNLGCSEQRDDPTKKESRVWWVNGWPTGQHHAGSVGETPNLTYLLKIQEQAGSPG